MDLYEMDLYEVAAQCARKNRSFSIATITGTSGRTPRRDGRMLVLPDGSSYGTVGGGEAEREVIDLAIQAMKEGRGRRVEIKVRDCGMLDVYIDVPVRGRKAVIFGSGHIARSVADTLFRIGFEITFMDDRAFDCPPGMTVLPCSALKDLVLDEKTAVIFSNPEDRDRYIQTVLAGSCPYIGVLSSRSRATIDNPRVFQPVGLDIGAETPEEIAISIAAQILAVMNGRPAYDIQGK